ncbi:Hypothetical protein Cul210932_0308 [Corynebacterium ulcerans]|nr:Hypothetical protein Cul210932_0308 [Corynebacterium ulcerans]AIU90909.1 Hypothetical protein Cul05146_0317 [Corynebacterium ulcerans]ALD94044.1 Hypothetical protein Cul131001_0313 [Corynebacterium ulcerans]
MSPIFGGIATSGKAMARLLYEESGHRMAKGLADRENGRRSW